MVFPPATSFQPGDCAACSNETTRLLAVASNMARKKLGCMFDTRFHCTSCPGSRSLLAKNAFGHGNGRHGLWPTSIERQMRYDFLELRLSKTVLLRSHQMAW